MLARKISRPDSCNGLPENNRMETIGRSEALDARVSTPTAHDWSLKGVIEEWPKPLNGREKGSLNEKSQWKGFNDSEGALNWQS